MIWLIFYMISIFVLLSIRNHVRVSNMIGNIPYFATVGFSWVFKDESAVRNGGKKHTENIR